MAKKVKFNCTTSVLQIPDNKYEAYIASMAKLEEENYEAFILKLKAGTKFKFQSVKAGDIIEVPDHYYEANKNRVIKQGVSFDKYTDRHGKRIPFNTAEAVKHGDMKDPLAVMQSVMLFDLIEGLTIKPEVKPKSQQPVMDRM
jgi:hypothetical protein